MKVDQLNCRRRRPSKGKERKGEGSRAAEHTSSVSGRMGVWPWSPKAYQMAPPPLRGDVGFQVQQERCVCSQLCTQAGWQQCRSQHDHLTKGATARLYLYDIQCECMCRINLPVGVCMPIPLGFHTSIWSLISL